MSAARLLFLAAAGFALFLGLYGFLFVADEMMLSDTTKLVVLIAGLPLVILGFMLTERFIELRRTQRLGALATAGGFTFRDQALPFDHSLIEDSQIARLNPHGTITNIVDAAAMGDFRVTLLDLSYVVGPRKARRTHWQSIVRVQSPLLQLPPFVMAPQSALARIGEMLGITDINFPEAPRFSKMYLLRGQDEPAIRQVFTPEVLQFFEQHPKLCIEGAGDRLLVYRERRRLKLENLETVLEEGRATATIFVRSSAGIPATATPRAVA